MQATIGVVAVAFVCGCSSSATLKLRDGSEVEGRILRSSAESIWVEGGNDQPLELEREDIVDVTHPGNWEIGVGTGLLALSVVLIGVGAAMDDQDPCSQLDRELGECSNRMNPDSAFAYLGALSVGVPGLILLGGGIKTYNASRLRYAPADSWARGAAPRSAKRLRVGFEL